MAEAASKSKEDMFLVDDVSDDEVVSDASEEIVLPQFAPRLKETKAPKKPKAERKKGKIQQTCCHW